MHAYMYSSLYTCNCTVLYSSFFSEKKNVNVNVSCKFEVMFSKVLPFSDISKQLKP